MPEWIRPPISGSSAIAVSASRRIRFQTGSTSATDGFSMARSFGVTAPQFTRNRSVAPRLKARSRRRRASSTSPSAAPCARPIRPTGGADSGGTCCRHQRAVAAARRQAAKAPPIAVGGLGLKDQRIGERRATRAGDARAGRAPPRRYRREGPGASAAGQVDAMPQVRARMRRRPAPPRCGSPEARRRRSPGRPRNMSSSAWSRAGRGRPSRRRERARGTAPALPPAERRAQTSCRRRPGCGGSSPAGRRHH